MTVARMPALVTGGIAFLICFSVMGQESADQGSSRPWRPADGGTNPLLIQGLVSMRAIESHAKDAVDARRKIDRYERELVDQAAQRKRIEALRREAHRIRQNFVVDNTGQVPQDPATDRPPEKEYSSRLWNWLRCEQRETASPTPTRTREEVDEALKRDGLTIEIDGEQSNEPFHSFAQLEAVIVEENRRLDRFEKQNRERLREHTEKLQKAEKDFKKTKETLLTIRSNLLDQKLDADSQKHNPSHELFNAVAVEMGLLPPSPNTFDVPPPMIQELDVEMGLLPPSPNTGEKPDAPPSNTEDVGVDINQAIGARFMDQIEEMANAHELFLAIADEIESRSPSPGTDVKPDVKPNDTPSYTPPTADDYFSAADSRSVIDLTNPNWETDTLNEYSELFNAISGEIASPSRPVKTTPAAPASGTSHQGSGDLASQLLNDFDKDRMTREEYQQVVEKREQVRRNATGMDEKTRREATTINQRLVAAERAFQAAQQRHNELVRQQARQDQIRQAWAEQEQRRRQWQYQQQQQQWAHQQQQMQQLGNAFGQMLGNSGSGSTSRGYAAPSRPSSSRTSVSRPGRSGSRKPSTASVPSSQRQNLGAKGFQDDFKPVTDPNRRRQLKETFGNRNRR